MSVNVVFSGDTGGFVASVDKMTGAVEKSGAAVANAKNTILESYKMQMAAAKELSASTSEMEAIQKRASQMLASVTDTNANRIVSALDRITAKQKAVAQEMAALNSVAAIPASREKYQVSNRMAASGTLMMAEGRQGIRPIEAFLSSIPMASAAMQAIFPILGMAGLTGLVVEFGKRGYEAFEKVVNAAADTRAAFAAVHDRAQVSIDDLDLENQRLQAQIDKLDGHPSNGLADSLAEAKKMADGLVESLQEDNKQLATLLKAGSTGFLGSVMSVLGMGPATTGSQSAQMMSDQGKLAAAVKSASDAWTEATAGVTDPAKLKAATDVYASTVHNAYQEQINNYQRDYQSNLAQQNSVHYTATRNGLIRDSGPDNSIKLANDQSRIQQLIDEQRMADARVRQYTLTQTLHSKQAGAGSGSSAISADEAQRRADEQQRRMWQQQDNAQRIAGTYTGAVPLNTWAQRMATLKPGSEQYLYAQQQVAERITQARQQDIEQRKRAQEQQQRDAELTQRQQATQWQSQYASWSSTPRSAQQVGDFWGVKALEATPGSANERAAVERMTAAYREEARAIKEAADARQKANQEAARSASQMELMRISIAVRTGQMSGSYAAQQVAGIHAQQYAATMAGLQGRLAEEQAINPNSAGSINAQAAIDAAKVNYQMQQMSDQMQEFSQTALGGATTALQAFTAASKNTAGMAGSAVTGAIGTTNAAIVRDLVTPASNRYQLAMQWTNVGRSVATNATGALLARGEGTAFGMLGLKHGKLGTKANPMYVKSADPPAPALNLAPSGAAGAASLGKALWSSTPASATSASTSSTVGSAVSHVVSAIIPALAGGGNLPAGHVALVGEQGPELVQFGSNAHVTPNNKLTSWNPGGTSHTHINVDARGSSDPAQTAAMVHQAIRAAAPHIVAASLHASDQRNARLPPAQRK